jgi:hypothetical protein
VLTALACTKEVFLLSRLVWSKRKFFCLAGWYDTNNFLFDDNLWARSQIEARCCM